MTASDEEILQTTIPATNDAEPPNAATESAGAGTTGVGTAGMTTCSVRIGGSERELMSLLESVALGLGMWATPWRENEFPDGTVPDATIPDGGFSPGGRFSDRAGRRVILIGDADDPEFLDAFTRWLERCGGRAPCPTLLLIAFPRFDEIRRWERCGAAVLPKPFRIADIATFLAKS